MKENWENEKAKLRIDPSFSSETFFLWSAILLLLLLHSFFLLSFLSVTSYRLQLRFQTRVIDWFSSVLHLRVTFDPSLRRRCPFQSKSSMQTQGNEVMHLESCNFVLIETKLLQPGKYFIPIIHVLSLETGKQTVKNNISNRRISGENVSSGNSKRMNNSVKLK